MLYYVNVYILGVYLTVYASFDLFKWFIIATLMLIHISILYIIEGEGCMCVVYM